MRKFEGMKIYEMQDIFINLDNEIMCVIQFKITVRTDHKN